MVKKFWLKCRRTVSDIWASPVRWLDGRRCVGRVTGTMSDFCTVSVTLQNISWNCSSVLSNCNSLAVAPTAWSMPLIVPNVHWKERFSCSSRPNTFIAVRNASNVVPFWKKSSKPGALVLLLFLIIITSNLLRATNVNHVGEPEARNSNG